MVRLAGFVLGPFLARRLLQELDDDLFDFILVEVVGSVCEAAERRSDELE